MQVTRDILNIELRIEMTSEEWSHIHGVLYAARQGSLHALSSRHRELAGRLQELLQTHITEA